MMIEALKRFNGHDAGEAFKADDADAEKWIGMGLAKASKKAEKDKGPDGPDKDKAEKGAPVKK